MLIRSKLSDAPLQQSDHLKVQKSENWDNICFYSNGSWSVRSHKKMLMEGNFVQVLDFCFLF